MSYEILSALALFALVTSMTPGPNNLMLMASGGNFGFRRTLPHMAGITLGFMLMLVLVGLGLAELFLRYPLIQSVLKVLSVGYLLFLAWKIATAAAVRPRDAEGRPLSLLQAAAFQWVNPKAWAFGLSIIALFAPQATLPQLLVLALVNALVCLPSITLWTVLGQQMARVLTNARRRRTFNWTMAALLVASLYPVVAPAG